MIINISREYLDNEIKKVKPHPASLNIFKNKDEVIPLKIFDIPAPGANIIKQEMLSLGGDAIVHKNAVDCNVDASDVILLGTKKHYNILIDKLKKMPYFKLDKVRTELKQYFSSKKPNSIKSPWGRTLTFDRTRVMGIINCKQTVEEILSISQNMIQNEVDVLDIGGMSTRPGSDPVSEEEEEKRVVSAVKTIRENYRDIMISIDTYRANVAKKALEAGADIINDVSGFGFDENLLEVIAKSNAPYVLMHSEGTSEDIQKTPVYDDLLREIMQYFTDKIQYATSLNMDQNNIILNPGLGFGKINKENMEIIDRMQELKSLHKPLLMDISRISLKSDKPEGILAVTALCAYQNIDIIRVHDVKRNTRIIEMIEAIKCRR